MARKANTVVSVDTATDIVLWHYPAKPDRVQRTNYYLLPKNDKGQALKMLGHKFDRPYIHHSVDELDGFYNAIKTNWSASPKPAPTPSPIPEEGNEVSVDNAIKELLKAVQEASKASVDLEQVRVAVEQQLQPVNDRIDSQVDVVWNLIKKVEELESRQPKVVEVHIPNHEPKKLDGIQHHQFPKILAHISVRNHILMVGPAGTGKSTIAEQCAEALGLAFGSKSVTAQTSEASLLGFISASGQYVTTEFRRRFEEGGVFLLDEVDAGNPNVLGVLNSALANGWMAFPDGMVKRHADFVAIAAGNTFGNGATAEYVGRNPLDKAFTDRFVTADIQIDESIETAMVMATGLQPEVATHWLNFVRKVRANVQANGLKVVVSPRGALAGAKMLTTGVFTNDEVISASILKGANPEQSTKMLAGASF